MTGMTMEVEMTAEIRRLPYIVPKNLVPPRGDVDISAMMQTVEGTIELTQGVMYKGQMKLGVPEGRGESYDLAGKEVIYRGEWKEGAYDGMGTLYSRGEQIVRGRFEKGWLKEGSRKLSSGAWFVGRFDKSNLPQGQGRLVFPTGMFVEGRWNGFKPVGNMEYHFPDGEVIGYDLEHCDDVTHLEIAFSPEMIVYVSTVKNSSIFYANGDIFVGSLISRRYPQNGDYYRFNGSGFMKLQYGERIQGLPTNLTLISVPGSAWKMTHVIDP